MLTLKKYKKIVIKIGSSIIIDKKTNNINTSWLNSICEDIKKLDKQNKKIVVVSSGAVALGKKIIMPNKQMMKLQDKQAAAAIGQIDLIKHWQKSFERKGLSSAQLLLMLSDSEERKRYVNACNTINTLIKKGIIPIVNENDTVATEEIQYGDNDRLAARVSQMIKADLLINLSEIDGFYSKNPNKNFLDKKLKKIILIDKRIENFVTKRKSTLGSGGMRTKIIAAKMCMSSGCSMVIADGKTNNPIKKINLSNSSWFVAQKNFKSDKKMWMVNHLKTLGEIQIDAGATKAIKMNKSLLPAGIIKIIGKFNKGDAVRIYDKNNKNIAVGLCSYDSLESRKIMGKKSSQINKILGYNRKDEFIHKDNLAIL